MAEGRTEKASGGRLGSPEKRTKDENEDEDEHDRDMALNTYLPWVKGLRLTRGLNVQRPAQSSWSSLVPDHTVPYGTVLSREAFPGTSCQATIGVVPPGRAGRHFATASS